MRTETRPSSPSAVRRAAGFTLVELLVVIGIIALLISILLPSLNKAREQAKAVQCMSNLRSIGQALFIYAVNNKDSLPWGQVDTVIDGTLNFTGQTTDWTVQVSRTLNPRYGDNYDTASAAGAQESKVREIFLCPSVAIDPAQTSSRSHYSVHPRLMPQDQTVARGGSGPRYQLYPYKLGSIKRAAEIAMAFDGTILIDATADGIPDYSAYTTAYHLDAYRLSYDTNLTDNYALATSDPSVRLPGASIDVSPDSGAFNRDTPENAGNIRFRHSDNKRANVLMADGHVEPFYLKGQYQTTMKRSNVYVSSKR